MISLGVLNFRHLLGLLLSRFWMVAISISLYCDISDPLGIYLLISPLVFSTPPFSQLWYGWQKNIGAPIRFESFSCLAKEISLSKVKDLNLTNPPVKFK